VSGWRNDNNRDISANKTIRKDARINSGVSIMNTKHGCIHAGNTVNLRVRVRLRATCVINANDINATTTQQQILMVGNVCIKRK